MNEETVAERRARVRATALEEKSFVARDHITATVRRELARFADDTLARSIGTAVGEMMRELELRFTAKLEAATKAVAFRGNWTEGASYRRGEIVSCGGSVHFCNVNGTTTKPGTDAAQWTLVIARPRDGRDAPAPAPPPVVRTVHTAVRGQR